MKTDTTTSPPAEASCSPFCPNDMDIAHRHFNAMCGHGALAAALGTSVLSVLPLFEKMGWVNIPVMKGAIIRAERSWRSSKSMPEQGNGVALIQWLGSWMNPGVPVGARCAYRHWIAFHDGLIWDANFPSWRKLADWEEWVDVIYPKKATGHAVEMAYIFDTVNAESIDRA